ncbi:MAG: ABC transporter permease [Acidobacteria bacterium]|nr:ABC transporter permease [Acidobacteriota bacterium]
MNTIATEINNVDSGASMPFGRILRAYIVESKYAFLSVLRMPVFSIPMIALPVFLYFLIGGMVVGPMTGGDPAAAVAIFSGFLVFAITGPGLFGFGAGLAVERQSGVLNLKRAQPMPPAAHLLAKMIMAMICTGIVTIILIPLAIWIGPMSVSAVQIVNLVFISMFGVLPFCAIGFFIGTFVSGTAAPGIVNLIFFPMLYLSGLFFPLPEILEPWAPIWPTFHLNQLVCSAAGMESIMDIKICFGVLLVLTAVCTVLAVRRLSRVG